MCDLLLFLLHISVKSLFKKKKKEDPASEEKAFPNKIIMIINDDLNKNVLQPALLRSPAKEWWEGL